MNHFKTIAGVITTAAGGEESLHHQIDGWLHTASVAITVAVGIATFIHVLAMIRKDKE